MKDILHTLAFYIRKYNPGQKCWEGSITLQITPSPLSMLDFLGRIW